MKMWVTDRIIARYVSCLAPYRLTVRELLDQRFPDRWIGRPGQIFNQRKVQN